MKTQSLTLAAALIMAFVFVMPVKAQFVSVKTEEATASVSVGGVSAVDFSLVIRNRFLPNIDLPELTWSGVNAGDQWVLSDTFLLLLGTTLTDLNGGIQIYTDNTDVAANPRFVDPTPGDPINADSNPAGMLLDDGSGTSSRSLPLAWTVKEGIPNPGTYGAADPNTGPDAGIDNRFQWLFAKDSGQGDIDNNGNGIPGEPAEPAGVDTNGNGIPGEAGEGTAFVNGDTFVTLANINGIHFGQAPNEFGGGVLNGETLSVFLEANFGTALPGQTYRSSRITVEAYTQ